MVCDSPNRNPDPNPNPVNLKAKNIEYAKKHIRQNSRSKLVRRVPQVVYNVCKTYANNMLTNCSHFRSFPTTTPHKQPEANYQNKPYKNKCRLTLEIENTSKQQLHSIVDGCT